MAEILIYGPIGATWDGDGVTAKGVADYLGGLRPTESIRMRINSPGGDVFEGIAIHNLLAERSSQVTVDIDGAAMSAASFVALAGSKVRMAENALMMIHNPWTVAMGEASDFDAMGALLRKVKESILDTYLVRASASRSRLSAMMDETTYLNAEEAQRMGFVDEITGAGVGAAAAKAKVNRLANLLKPPEEAQEGRGVPLSVMRAKLELLKTRLGIGDVEPANVCDGFETLVAALEREIQGPLSDEREVHVILNDERPELAFVLAGFHQQVVALLCVIEGNPFVPSVRV